MLTLLNEKYPEQAFPPIETALTEPDGLLAMGGCLSSKRLINAYRHGIFPWYNPGDSILWWSPDPRLVIFPERLHIARSLRKKIHKQLFNITVNQAFADVMTACAEPREYESGTWISQEMQQAYHQLYRLGYAHSVEAWSDNKLVGGLYGVAIGQVFFGESMFHRHTDASKIAFVTLIQHLKDWQYQLVDCQVHTRHLVSLGAESIPRTSFQKLLHEYCAKKPNNSAWRMS